MQELTVTYHISDEQEKRLQKIAEKSKEHGLKNATLNHVFESIMLYGSKYDIEDKLKLQELELGITND